MAQPFIPGTVPVPWTQSRPGSNRSVGSLSSSLESLRSHAPWMSGSGVSSLPSIPSQPREPDLHGTRREFERSSGVYSNVESCPSQGNWDDRPPTPTLLGYEVMEERSKFTVYKILVRRTADVSWVVFRRYADFSRLNDKLKEMFPRFKLSLPPKRWFRDNYNMSFLEERQLGLQAFLQNLVVRKDIADSEAVRAFLCLDDPPGPFDSLEESRAFCETLEETNHRLQKELHDKHKEIESLKKLLGEREFKISSLEKEIATDLALSPERCCKPLIYSESSTGFDTEEEEEEDEEDTKQRSPPAGHQRHAQSCENRMARKSHGACWCGPASSHHSSSWSHTPS